MTQILIQDQKIKLTAGLFFKHNSPIKLDFPKNSFLLFYFEWRLLWEEKDSFEGVIPVFQWWEFFFLILKLKLVSLNNQ